jgi:hypothetical protein
MITISSFLAIGSKPVFFIGERLMVVMRDRGRKGDGG